MQHRALRTLILVGLIAVATTLAGCGGGSSSIGGGSSSSSGSSSGGSTVTNYVPVTVDSGVGGSGSPNTLYTTVTICAHGSTTNCQTIDHIQVDTGSYGFRVLSEALTVSGLTAVTDSSGNAIIECTTFADGYSWGPVSAVDLKVGGLTATSLPIQIIGVATYNSMVPTSCSTQTFNGTSVALTAEDTVAAFGANGVLGIGVFAQDCGTYCTDSANSQAGYYYSCTTGGTCTPTTVNLNTQVQNPVPLFGSDNNGIAIKMDALSAPGAASASGTLFFGIGTQSNNALSATKLYSIQTTGTTAGTFSTTYAGVADYGILDTGSNGYFFSDGSIPTCTQYSGFFCPSGSDALSATIAGSNGGNATTVDFTIDNAATLFGYNYWALPTLGGSTGSTLSGAFDWGLPFFYGRTVFVALDGASLSGTTSVGPWVGF